MCLPLSSAKTFTRAKSSYLHPVKEELCPGARCTLPRSKDSPPHSESYGPRRGTFYLFFDSIFGVLPHSQQREVEKHFEEVDTTEGQYPDERRMQQYSNLFFLLQSEPRHIAALCRLVSLTEIDTLLQTVMFTLYGNQYESREEHLLLTMFQSVLSAQFDTATEFGSLLRANTPVSRMMTTYTRRGPGQSYLKSVLADRINSLIEHKELNLEINPVKVGLHYRIKLLAQTSLW
jgi:hypothetical protein